MHILLSLEFPSFAKLLKDIFGFRVWVCVADIEFGVEGFGGFWFYGWRITSVVGTPSEGTLNPKSETLNPKP